MSNVASETLETKQKIGAQTAKRCCCCVLFLLLFFFLLLLSLLLLLCCCCCRCRSCCCCYVTGGKGTPFLPSSSLTRSPLHRPGSADLNSGLALLSEIQIPRNLLLPFHTIYSKWQVTLPALEQSPSSRRAGGRGIGPKRSKNRRKGGENAQFILFFLTNGSF